MLAGFASFIAFIISCYSSYKSTSYQSCNQGTNLKGFKELIYILKSPSVYFFIMVFLGACIYTTIINLQTTFAKSQGLDYVYFYFFYSVAVVLARFFISKPLNSIEPKRSISFLLILMIIGLIFMCFAIDSIILYIAGALLLGLGYGLVYPIIQAQATNYSSKNMQAQTLVYFSLSYFIAVYLFPYFGAFIATTYSYDNLMYILIFLVIAELITAFYFYKVIKNLIVK